MFLPEEGRKDKAFALTANSIKNEEGTLQTSCSIRTSSQTSRTILSNDDSSQSDFILFIHWSLLMSRVGRAREGERSISDIFPLITSILLFPSRKVGQSFELSHSTRDLDEGVSFSLSLCGQFPKHSHFFFFFLVLDETRRFNDVFLDGNVGCFCCDRIVRLLVDLVANIEQGIGQWRVFLLHDGIVAIDSISVHCS